MDPQVPPFFDPRIRADVNCANGNLNALILSPGGTRHWLLPISSQAPVPGWSPSVVGLQSLMALAGWPRPSLCPGPCFLLHARLRRVWHVWIEMISTVGLPPLFLGDYVTVY